MKDVHFFWSAKGNEPKKTDPPLNALLVRFLISGFCKLQSSGLCPCGT